jgi:hypothetical protein
VPITLPDALSGECHKLTNTQIWTSCKKQPSFATQSVAKRTFAQDLDFPNSTFETGSQSGTQGRQCSWKVDVQFRTAGRREVSGHKTFRNQRKFARTINGHSAIRHLSVRILQTQPPSAVSKARFLTIGKVATFPLVSTPFVRLRREGSRLIASYRASFSLQSPPVIF